MSDYIPKDKYSRSKSASKGKERGREHPQPFSKGKGKGKGKGFEAAPSASKGSPPPNIMKYVICDTKWFREDEDDNLTPATFWNKGADLFIRETRTGKSKGKPNDGWKRVPQDMWEDRRPINPADKEVMAGLNNELPPEATKSLHRLRTRIPSSCTASPAMSTTSSTSSQRPQPVIPFARQ